MLERNNGRLNYIKHYFTCKKFIEENYSVIQKLKNIVEKFKFNYNKYEIKKFLNAYLFSLKVFHKKDKVKDFNTRIKKTNEKTFRS